MILLTLFPLHSAAWVAFLAVRTLFAAVTTVRHLMPMFSATVRSLYYHSSGGLIVTSGCQIKQKRVSYHNR
jgi:hypothetical protein